MVVCKYFLQGSCRFGNSCYYEHQNPNEYKNVADNRSILRQTTFNATKPTTTVDINALIKAVVADMTGAEKGGQWLLSCYAPFKEKPAFPGFEDTSPEEIRLGYYEARKNGTVDQYKQQLQGVLQSALLKIRALQNPDQEVVSILQRIYNTPPSSCSGTFGQNNSNNTNQNTTNIFANNSISPVSNPSNFTINNIFASPPQQAQSQPNIFANAQSNMFQQSPTNLFNQLPNTTNVFANASQQINVPSAPESARGNIFSNSMFMEGAQTIPNTVNTHNSSPNFIAQSNSVFEQQQKVQTNIFATQNVQTSAIPNQNVLNSNLFNRNNSNFGVPQEGAQSVAANYSAGIFGNPSQPIQRNTPIDMTVYSKIEELGEKERQWFQSDDLSIFDIPDKPPTYEMCFN